MTHSQSQLLEQLSRNSIPYQDPLTRVEWDKLDLSAFWLPESAISLYGTIEYDDLPIERRLALSHYEFLNFLEGALWLEGLFMERISRSMWRMDSDISRIAYRLHELREEAGHSLLFLELMRRSGLPLPRSRFARHNLANLLGRFAPFHSTLFWTAVLIGEEVPDRMNRLIRKHREEICPVVYDMVTLHIIDEARHIAHARQSLEPRMARLNRLQLALYRPLINRIFKQFVHAFYFPGPRVYELAGLDQGRHWARLARRNPVRRRFVNDCVSSALRQLRELGLSLDWR